MQNAEYRNECLVLSAQKVFLVILSVSEGSQDAMIPRFEILRFAQDDKIS